MAHESAVVPNSSAAAETGNLVETTSPVQLGVMPQTGPVDCRWMAAICEGLHLEPYLLTSMRGMEPVGTLPLAYVSSLLFGRHLVSLPYMNTAGIWATDDQAACDLVEQAVALAHRLKVKSLQLRQTQACMHPKLQTTENRKVLMRRPLPATTDLLWKEVSCKVRNQVRKGEKCNLTAQWGRDELLRDFYEVFSVNMRDLGTPVYGVSLFRALLKYFGADAELCVVYSDKRPLAGAILIHGANETEVPSASSLREFNHTNANMFLYWQLLQRAVTRGQQTFNFGRSTIDSNTYQFKKQWGATPFASVWQAYELNGKAGDLRPDNPKMQRAIELWKRLPVWLTKLIGPSIVRGIP